MDRIAKGTLFGLLVLLSGCISYSTINLDILNPAGVKFPVEIASVVIVDNALPYRDTAIHEVQTESRRYKLDTLYVDDFGHRLVESLGRNLRDQQFFDSVHVVEVPMNIPGSGEDLRPLSYFQIDSLSRRYNAQAVISLDQYKYHTTTNVVDLTNFYYLTLDARSRSYWKIYNALNGELMDIYLQQDTIFWEGEGYSLNHAFSGLPGLGKAVEAVADYSGAKYAGHVAPSWSTVNRLYFTEGHPLFFQATDFALKGKWDKALPIWYRVYEAGRGKQKARAAFNIALGQETQGNFKEALAWAYRSLQHYGDLGFPAASEWEKQQAKMYYVELSTRLQKKKKLDDQFGFEE
jgi:hypothetical protein